MEASILPANRLFLARKIPDDVFSHRNRCQNGDQGKVIRQDLILEIMNPKIARRKHIRAAVYLFIMLVITSTIIVGFWRPGLLLGQPNDGHQLGGDLMSDLSGNTIECFARAIREHESKNSWLYAECDVRETSDHHLVVFHDWDISSLPDSESNRLALEEPVRDQAICDLSLAQIEKLHLKCGCKIPTLKAILSKANDLKLEKKLLLEFKYLHSDVGREKLLDLATTYRDQHGLDIHFLAFIRNVDRSFPESGKWLSKFSESGFRVYQVFRPKTEKYDLCKTLN